MFTNKMSTNNLSFANVFNISAQKLFSNLKSQLKAHIVQSNLSCVYVRTFKQFMVYRIHRFTYKISNIIVNHIDCIHCSYCKTAGDFRQIYNYRTRTTFISVNTYITFFFPDFTLSFCVQQPKL